jgi:hypothetical protein
MISPRALIIGLLFMGCTAESPSTPSTPSTLETPPPVSSKSPSTQGIPPINPAYAPGPDPLLALYGGRHSKSSKESFKAVKSVEVRAPLPKLWRTLIGRLSAGDVQAKVERWSYTRRTRMTRGRQDEALSFTVHLYGPSKEIHRALSKAFSLLKKALPRRPKRWMSSHSIEGAPYSWSLIRTASSDRYATYDFTWDKTAPPPTSLRNCRSIHTLNPPPLAHEWMIRHFKSTGSRRFVEWSYTLDPNGERLTSLWIYRNGIYRDQGVGWWRTQLEKRGATREEMEGMSQEWRLSEGETLSWEPESDPPPLGCEVRGPFLSVTWSSVQ